MLAKQSNEVQKCNMFLQKPIGLEFHMRPHWKQIRSLIISVARLVVGDTKITIQYCLKKFSQINDSSEFWVYICFFILNKAWKALV